MRRGASKATRFLPIRITLGALFGPASCFGPSRMGTPSLLSCAVRGLVTLLPIVTVACGGQVAPTADRGPSGAGEAPGASTKSGQLVLQLTLNGLGAYDGVAYSASSAEHTYTGAFATGRRAIPGTLSVVIGNLEPGPGYIVTLTPLIVEGGANCHYQSSPQTILAGQTTVVTAFSDSCG
jgi:hypothetical protein